MTRGAGGTGSAGGTGRAGGTGGRNAPAFIEAQLEFAAHIRNPDLNPAPADVEARRMRVYVDLFHRNIEGFLARGFPVAKQTLDTAVWDTLVRGFIHRHGSHSPYFLDVTQEFMTWLGEGRTGAEQVAVPDWLLELCHYEWVEMALGVDPAELDLTGIDRAGDPFEENAALNPLMWPLAYRFPVHRIGPGRVPDGPPAEPTCVVVYRDPDDRVRFLESSPATHRLIELLDGTRSGRAAARLLAGELRGSTADPIQSIKDRIEDRIEADVAATLARLRAAEVVLGTRR